MRIDKVLEEADFGSRKQVKRLLLTGEVRVNGNIVRQPDYNVDGSLDELVVQGKRVDIRGHSYFMLNKPQGVVTAVRDERHSTVLDLLRKEEVCRSLFPVGRLDRDTEGLLLLTNNGKLAYRLLQPENKVVKGYEVVVNGLVTEKDIQTFEGGVVFHDGTVCLPAKLAILSSTTTSSHVYLEIYEGKLHQVKKMFLVVGKKVTYLKRVKMGELRLDPQLKVGEYRALKEVELKILKGYFNPRQNLTRKD